MRDKSSASIGIKCIGSLGLFLLWHNGCNPKLAVSHTNRKVHSGVRIDVHQVGADYWMGILLCRQSSDGRRGGLPEARCEGGRRLRLSKIVLKYHLRKHSEITVVFMGKSNSSIRHEIPRG